DDLHFAGPGPTEGRRPLVFLGVEAGDAPRKSRKLDHDEAVEFLRSFHDLVASAAHQHLAAMLGQDRRHLVGVFLVFGRIIDLRAADPIGGHRFLLATGWTGTWRQRMYAPGPVPRFRSS